VKKLIWILLPLFLNSCGVALGLVGFEVLEPAKVVLPASSYTPCIINRSPLDPYIIDPPSERFLDKQELYILDTIIINHIRKGINEIAEQNLLDFTRQPVWYEIRRKDQLGVDIPLSSYETSQIFDSTGTDILFSLEKYHIKTNIDVYQVSEDYDYYAEISIYPEFQWNVYLPGHPRPAYSYTFNDTLYYGNYGSSRYEALQGSEMPTPLEIIRQVALISGEDFASYFMPHWSGIEREMYQGNEEVFKETAKYSNNGEWDKAVAIWEVLLTSEKKGIKQKAAYNMAIWYEMNDDLDKALEYAQLSENLFPAKFTENYIHVLKQRIKDRELLVRQLHY